MKIEVDEDNELVLKEVFSGVGLQSPSGETFGIAMRDSGFEFRYGGHWWEAKKGRINRLPSVGEKKSLRECQESLSEKEIEINRCIVEALNDNSDFEEEIRPYMSEITPKEPDEALGREGSFEESSEGYGEFDLNRLYKQKDVCIYCGITWRFIGKNWAMSPDPSERYRTYFYTQTKTIGMYPSEEFGWRKI